MNEYYLRDHTGREVAIYNNGGTTLKSINLFGNGLLGYATASGSRYYYIKDHLGSIRQVRNGSNTVASKNYQPYGSIIAEYNSGTDYRYDFTEKQRDKETDFNYFGARYYDSDIGRWTTVDPLADLAPGWSPYSYSFNNPLNYTDPDGRFPWGALIGAGVELASQVASDMLVNDMSFGDAFGNVDWADVGTAGTVGLVTGGLSSLKTVGTLGKIGINVAGSVGEGAVKANVGNKTYDYSVGDAATDVLIGGGSSVFGEVGKKVAQSTETAKGLKKTAKRLSNIAETGRARPAQALRAANAAKAAASYGSGKAAETINQSTSTTIHEILKKEEEKN